MGRNGLRRPPLQGSTSVTIRLPGGLMIVSMRRLTCDQSNRMISNDPPSEAAELNNGSWTARLSAALHLHKYESHSNSTLGSGDKEAGVSRTPGWQTRPGAEFAHLRPQSSNWIGDIMDRIQSSIHAMDIRAIVAVIVIFAFALGWTGGSIFNSTAHNLQLATPASKSGPSIANDLVKTQPDEIQKPASPSKSASVAAKPSGSSRSIIASRAGPPPARQLIQERNLTLLPANMETQPPRLPAPETRPTTVEGWSVRSVDYEGAILVGPDHVWTVKPGDVVPDLGRIDNIVRWGKYWVVGTSSGIISSE